MIKDYNVIIDAFKPGVMEKLGIGPNECFKINPKLVYARISSINYFLKKINNNFIKKGFG